MVGGYGLGIGISQGLDKVADSYTNRQKVQQQAQMFNQQMNFNQQNQQMRQQQFDTQQEQAQLQIQQMELKYNELANQLAKRDTFDALRAFEATGDATLLNNAKQNPKVAQLFANSNISGFLNPNDLSAEKKAELGITDEVLKNPTKRIVLASLGDGSVQPMDMMNIYARTGFLNELGTSKLQEMTNYAKMQQVQAQTSILEDKALTSSVATNDMLKWLEANPDKTYNDYQSLSKKSTTYAPSTQEKDLASLKADFDSGKLSEEEYNKLVTATRNKYAGLSPTAGQKETSERLDDFENFKAQSGASENWDIDVDKLDSKSKTKIMTIAAKERDKYIKEDIAQELPKLTTAANKLNVNDLSKTTGIVDASVMEAMDRLGIDLGDKVYTQSSNYNIIKNSLLKAMYGSQISQADRDSITDQIGSIYRSDSGVRTKLIQNLDTMIAQYDNYKTIAPAYFAVNMKKPLETLTQVRNSLDVDSTQPSLVPILDNGKVDRNSLVVGKVYTSPDGKESMVWNGSGWSKPEGSK